MKINNVEKFREELYRALKDNYMGSSTEESNYMWKDGNERTQEMMDDVQYDWNAVEERPEAISLPQPMHFRDYKVAIVVEEDGVTFWDTSMMSYYEMIGYVSTNVYINRMSFSMAVIKTLEQMKGKVERRLANRTGGRFNIGDRVRIDVHEEDTPSLRALEHNGEVFTIRKYVDWCDAYGVEEIGGLWSEDLFVRA